MFLFSHGNKHNRKYKARRWLRSAGGGWGSLNGMAKEGVSEKRCQ